MKQLVLVNRLVARMPWAGLTVAVVAVAGVSAAATLDTPADAGQVEASGRFDPDGGGGSADQRASRVVELRAGQSAGLTEFCCNGVQCTQVTPGQCNPSPGRVPVAHLDELRNRLRLTQTRTRGVSLEPSRNQAALYTEGDGIAWYFDHPGVTVVVHGIVGEVSAYRDYSLEQNFTRCRIRVLAFLKGTENPEFSFAIPGGTAGGHSEYSSDVRFCRTGEEIIVFLMGWGPGLSAVGGSSLYFLLAESDGTRTATADLHESFLHDIAMGAEP